jgi:hypothetical protein
MRVPVPPAAMTAATRGLRIVEFGFRIFGIADLEARIQESGQLPFNPQSEIRNPK